jgi:hypothetical protein
MKNTVDAYGRLFWIINIHNYGKFAYYGTEKEAEYKRKCKSNWEQSIGIKRLANTDKKEDLELIESYHL